MRLAATVDRVQFHSVGGGCALGSIDGYCAFGDSIPRANELNAGKLARRAALPTYFLYGQDCSFTTF
jgi:hypothetical protein